MNPKASTVIASILSSRESFEAFTSALFNAANAAGYVKKEPLKQERKSARRYEDSTEATANDAFKEVKEKALVKSSVEFLYEQRAHYLIVSRGVKGMGAFVKRLEKMNLLDAYDRIDLTNERVLEVLARTRGVKSWFFDDKLRSDGLETVDAVEYTARLKKLLNFDFSGLDAKRERAEKRAENAAKKQEKAAKKASAAKAKAAQKRIKELAKDATVCLYLETLLNTHNETTLRLTA